MCHDYVELLFKRATRAVAITAETAMKIEPQKTLLTGHYVILPAYWQGRTAYLEGKAREENPHEEETDRLTWLAGWDDEEETILAFQCIHDWEPDEAGEYCLICGERKT